MTVYTILPEDDLNLEVIVTDPNDPRITVLDDLSQNVTVTEQVVTIDITPASINLTGAVDSVNGLTGVVSLTTTEIPEGTNEYYTDARADARVDLQTGANLDLSFMDTDDLAEGPTNLYYTAARDTAQFNTDLATKDTDDLTEGSNLYYTAARDSAQFDTDLATKDTDDLSEGSNLYFTDARAQTVITANTEAFIKANSTDTLTNKSGSNSQWTNTEAYIKADSTDTLTNKSGSNSQWTNDEAYLKANALTPYYTSTQVDALPVSTFTNDAGYITSETDSQTLSFTTPTLTISNGNNVDLTSLKYTDADVDSHLTTDLANADELLMWDGNDWAWFTPSNVASSNDYNDLDNLPTIPTQTTINNNADNRIITGSGTADTLEGEADFTWDGNNGVIDGSAGGLTTPVLNIKTDNSSWNTGQMMLSDSNDDVCTLVGANRNNFYEYNFTLDPNNTNGRSGATTNAGDYFIAFRKDYSDAANVKMNLTAFGAHGGFDFIVRDDYNNGGGNQYKGRPLNFNCLETNFNLGPDRNVLALTVAEESIDCKVPIGQARLSSDPASPSGGWTYYNTTTNKLRLYVDGTGWVDLN